MEKSTHGIDEKTFEELDFVGQARAINGTARAVERMIIAHLKRAKEKKKNVADIRQKYIDLLQRLMDRIKTC